MSDRTYWHVPGARSWHALAFLNSWQIRTGECGRGYPMNPGSRERSLELASNVEVADRIPPTAHLCGNCARIIAARTDIERVEDVPEPVATEHDDFEGAVPV